MKLYYLANNRLPTEKAHGLQIVKTASAFIENKLPVCLVVPNRRQPDNLKNLKIEHYYHLPQSIPVKKLPCLDFLLLRSKYRLPDWFGLMAYFLQSITFYLAVWTFCLFKKGLFYSRDLLVLLTLSILGKTCYFEGHQFPATGLGRFLYRLTLSRASGVIVITKQLKDLYVKNFNLPSEKILVAPDGVDLDLFEAKKSKNSQPIDLPKDKKIIMYTGSLYPWKGVYDLAEAGQYLDNKNCLIYIIGGDEHDGDLKKLQKFIAAKKLDGIILTGHLPYEKIPAYLNRADILVIPNSAKDPQSAAYTSPLKLFEYMASGKPIIASDAPVLKEVLDDTTAIFFTADSPKSLAEKIDYLLQNPAKAQSLSQSALKKVRQYSWTQRAKSIIEFIKLLL